VTFIAPATSVRFFVYDAAVACSPAPASFLHAIWTNGLNVECLSVAAALVPVNDEPCGAIAIPLVNSNCATPVSGTTNGATQTSANSLDVAPLNPNSAVPFGCGAVNFSGADVWYSVTVPATGYIGINTVESDLCAGAIGLYTAPSCAAGPYSWVGGSGLCSIDGLNAANTAPGIVINPATYGLTPGQTVYIRYWERNNNENGDFTICAYNAPVPAGEDPCNSILLTAADPCVPVQYNTENAQPVSTSITVAAPSCGNPGIPINDMWFRVVVPATGAMTVTTIAGTLTDMAMAWYRLSAGSACGPGTMTQIPGVGCHDNQSIANRMPRINSSVSGIALTPGETIYIRVWNREAGRSNYYGTFSICITPNNPPPNDDPCGAIALSVEGDCILFPSTNENATNTVNHPTTFPPGASFTTAPSCGAPANGDVWFTIDVPGDLIAPYGVNIDTDDLLALDFALAVYRDTTAIPGCGDANGLKLVQIAGACSLAGSAQGNALMPSLTLNVPTITPGERLYIRVWRSTTAQGIFSICARRTDPVLCSGTIYDSGGPSGNYSDNENTSANIPANNPLMLPFCPSKVGDVVTLTFTEFNIENGWDFMRIYNGTSAAAPLIGTYTGTNSPGTVTASLVGNPSGCLFVAFTSDGVINLPGYRFKVSCSPPLPTPPPPVGDCGVFTYDPGGPTGNYANNIGVAPIAPPYTQTWCPNVAGEVVTLTFSSFNVEANWDQVWIFNDDVAPVPPATTNMINSGNGTGFFAGNSIYPLGGAYWGNGIVGPFTATITGTNPNGCLTLVFTSDFSVTPAGWAGQVTCGPPPPPDPPPVGDCGVVFFDPGGAGNYGNNQTSTQTYCAPAGQLLTVTFTQFSLENNWDKLYVFDGPTTASPMISSGNGVGFGPAPFGPGAFWGNGIPGPFTSSTPGGCLTFHFVSDASVVQAGYRARTSCAPQAPNDNPCTPVGATLVNVNTSCIPQTFNNNNSTGTPAVPPPGCGNYQGSDVWFRFVAPPSGRVFIDSHAGTMTDGVMALYSGLSCAGPLSLIQCSDDDGEGLMPQIDRMCTPLVPGQTYYLRYFGYAGQLGTFDLCIVTTGGQTTLQSDCGGAFSLCSDAPFANVGYGSGCGSDLSAVNWGCLAGGERQGEWYAFQVQNAGNLGMTITPSGPTDIDWAVWGPFSSAALPNPVGGACIPTSPPKRCSNASLNNTQTWNAGTAVTGMGSANATLNSPQFTSSAFVLTDGPPTLAQIDGWAPGINVLAGQVWLLFVDDHHITGGSYTVSWNTVPTVPGNQVMGCVLLPIELVQLEAKPRITTVDLLWTTSSEQNSSHFLVERSADGRDFEVIGSVDAMGDRSIPTDYQFTDENPIRGMNYYRLRMVDLDGTSGYSNVVTALFEPDEVRIMVVPNPTRDRADIVMSSIYEDNLIVRITDGSGRLISTYLAPSGAQRIELPIEKLEAGSYTVQLVTQQGATFGRTRFVKQ
jgi:hypothetical protein